MSNFEVNEGPVEATEQLIKDRMFTEHGYTNLREINGMSCGVSRFLFTCGVCYGLDEVGYVGRYCFDTHQNASLFLKEWDGVTNPVIGEDGCKAIK